MQRLLPFAFILLCFLTAASPNNAHAQASRCLAMADIVPPAIRTSLVEQELSEKQVRLTFVTHSTFRIESPGGVIIATDYSGYAGIGPLPNVVTMNKAHSTHFTNYPDPAIEHVLRGWNPDGGAANHNLTINDVMIRNIPTNIRTWEGITEPDGNSIFVFELAGLCFGHLGHLHHELSAQHLGWVGRLDVVFVPVDGSYTMDHDSMVQVLRDLRASIIIPMHYFGTSTLQAFLERMGADYEIELADEATIILSEADLPLNPKVLVLPGY